MLPLPCKSTGLSIWKACRSFVDLQGKYNSESQCLDLLQIVFGKREGSDRQSEHQTGGEEMMTIFGRMVRLHGLQTQGMLNGLEIERSDFIG